MNCRLLFLSVGVIALLSLVGCSNPLGVSQTAGSASKGMIASGSISAQYTDSPSGEGIANAVDSNSATKYLTFHTAVWLQWNQTGQTTVSKYAVTSANDFSARDPKAWTLYGSNDGVAWTNLDSRSDQSFAARFQRNEYALTNTASFNYYKLDITQNNGATITQLAEWELTGVVSSSVVTVYKDLNYTGYAVPFAEGRYTLAALKARGVLDNDITSFRISSGYRVTLYDGDNFTGTSLVKTVDDPLLVSDGFNDMTSSLVIDRQPTGDWSNFVPPAVDFSDEASGLEGSTIFANAIPNVTQMMTEQCLAICKELYTDNNDQRVTFNKLHLLLQNDPTGVAAKWGNATEIWIGISAQYIANFYHNNGNNPALVLKEVRGILSHEGTHGYQFSPKNCGSYDGSSTYWGFVEGEADGIRGELTNWTPTRYPSKGGNWNSGYTTGGFFLDWCKHNKKATFFIELNHAARDMATFTWEAAFQQILGQSVQSVWDEYQNTL